MVAQVVDVLTRYLDQVESAQSRMQDVLSRRRAALLEGRLNELDGLAAEQERVTAGLQTLSAARVQMLATATRNGRNAITLTDLSRELGLAPAVTSRMEGLRRQAQGLQQEAWTQWIIANRQVQHLGELVEVIAAAGQQTRSYPGESRSGGGGLLDASI